MMKRSELNIPATREFVRPSLEFLLTFAEQAKVEDAQFNRIRSTCDRLFKVLLSREEQEVENPGGLRIAVQSGAGVLEIEIQNQGTPVTPSALQRAMQSELTQAPEIDLAFFNEGRKGQILRMKIRTRGAGGEADRETIEETQSGSEIRIERLDESCAEAITELFYQTYHYRYINEYVYYPEKIRDMITSGKLIPIGARRADGTLVGHIGILRWNAEPAVYEAALGVVNPRFNGNGLFGRIFARVIETLKETPNQYCVYDFVTNHDFSQRMVAKYGFCELALFLGNQVAETQAKLETLGIGTDSKEMARYSLLVGVGPGVAHPFGKRIVLPTNMGEACDFLLKPLAVEWVPAPRFYPLPPAGEYRLTHQAEQRAVIFDFFSPGRQALARIITDFQRYLREGVQYFAVDVPLDVPGIGQLYDLLAKHGFFMAGFVPCHYSERLGFRFQFLSPTKVDFENIRLYREPSRKLLKMIQENFERNSRL